MCGVRTLRLDGERACDCIRITTVITRVVFVNVSLSSSRVLTRMDDANVSYFKSPANLLRFNLRSVIASLLASTEKGEI